MKSTISTAVLYAIIYALTGQPAEAAAPSDIAQPGMTWAEGGESFSILWRGGEWFQGRYVHDSGREVREMTGNIKGDCISWQGKDVHKILGKHGLGDWYGYFDGDKIYFNSFPGDGKGGVTGENHTIFTLVRPTGSSPASAVQALPAAAPAAESSSAPKATVYAPQQTQIQILKEQGLNLTAWVTSPLETPIPHEIPENLEFMREALRDEEAAKPASDTAMAGAYSAALRYLSALLHDIEQRKLWEASAGGDAVLHAHSNLTEYRRDHLTWPQYALEHDERVERHEQAAYAKPFMDSKGPQRWEIENQKMRQELMGFYVEFREYLREATKQQ